MDFADFELPESAEFVESANRNLVFHYYPVADSPGNIDTSGFFFLGSHLIYPVLFPCCFIVISYILYVFLCRHNPVMQEPLSPGEEEETTGVVSYDEARDRK